MKLFYRELGAGQPLIILHGLLGSSDNWYTLSKIFAEKFRVFVVDQRNHGQSPHSTDHNYKLLTEDLKDFLNEHSLENPIIIGHSMGGKTAMNFAIKYPDLVDKIIIVDIVPKAYPVHHDAILDGLKAIPLKTIQSRGEADAILSEYVPEPSVRQFLLKNLARDENKNFEWKMNLSAIDQHIEEMGASLQYEGKFDKPSLFIKGEKSNYYGTGDETKIKGLFPKAQFVTLQTGHWVQAEDPKAFMNAVGEFLNLTF